MNAISDILNKQTACILFSEQAARKSTLSEAGMSILCVGIFGKETKKYAENLQMSDFVLHTHTHTHTQEQTHTAKFVRA